MNVYEQVIYKTRYAKYLPEEGRREEYKETVDRYWDAIKEKAAEHGVVIKPDEEAEIKAAMLNREVLPSMRGFMTAGKALDRDEGAIYNCSYVGLDSVFAFQEILFTLMLGTGVGFSVEKQFVSKLPTVADSFRKDDNIYTIQDSKEGWADAIGYVINALYDGVIPSVDYSLIRPKGAKLNTFGGRASGPEPLRNLIEFVAKVMMGAKGRQLRSIEVHDIVCMIASCVVSGGVRRSALISISDLDDIEMRDCKSGKWWEDNMQRALANNSAAYEGKPSREVFDAEWKALATSGSGERGIFNRYAARKKAEECDRVLKDGFGTNPCVTGDTWVAVADGRGRVQIKDLAESGEDVDVFTVKDGNLVVRKMLQPRKTELLSK
jgi:ribonucleoside-triphosphate reductase (thioredoxin)